MLSKLVQTPDVAGGLADCAVGQQEAAGPAVRKHGSQVVCNGALLVLKVGTTCWQQQAAVYHLLVISWIAAIGTRTPPGSRQQPTILCLQYTLSGQVLSVPFAS